MKKKKKRKQLTVRPYARVWPFYGIGYPAAPPNDPDHDGDNDAAGDTDGDTPPQPPPA